MVASALHQQSGIDIGRVHKVLGRQPALVGKNLVDVGRGASEVRPASSRVASLAWDRAHRLPSHHPQLHQPGRLFDRGLLPYLLPYLAEHATYCVRLRRTGSTGCGLYLNLVVLRAFQTRLGAGGGVPSSPSWRRGRPPATSGGPAPARGASRGCSRSYALPSQDGSTGLALITRRLCEVVAHQYGTNGNGWQRGLLPRVGAGMDYRVLGGDRQHARLGDRHQVYLVRLRDILDKKSGRSAGNVRRTRRSGRCVARAAPHPGRVRLPRRGRSRQWRV